MSPISFLKKEFALAAALFPGVLNSGIADQLTSQDAGNTSPQNEKQNKITRPALLGIKKKIAEGLYLRADIIPESSNFEVVVLGGSTLSKQNAKELLNNNFYSLYSGTFFSKNTSLGDIVGVSMDEPSKSLTKPFSWGQDTRAGKSISQRFCFGIKNDDSFEVIRRSEIKILEGSNISSEYKFLLGGLARIDLSDRKTLGYILERKRTSFVKQFNLDNRNYNRCSAYDGLDGHRNRARNGVILCEDPKTGQRSVVLMCIGHGNRTDGVTIFGYSIHAIRLLREHSLVPISIALADGGSSVSFGNKAEGSRISYTPTYTAFGIRSRK